MQTTMSDADMAAVESGRKTCTAVRFRQWQARQRGITAEELDRLDRRERDAEHEIWST